MNLSKIFKLSIMIPLVFLLTTSPIMHHQATASDDVIRIGAWVDSITLSAGSGGPEQIKDGTIDIDTGLYPPEEFAGLQTDPSIDLSTANGLYYDYTLNPAVFTDTSQINPFSVARIREALNWLVDRDYLNQLTYSGLALEKFFPIITGFPDYVRYADKVQELETYYAYNRSLADATINTEMLTLGAEKTGGIWHYLNQPVVIKFIIRNDSDGLRIPMGDYLADQLESIGFVTDRQYLTSSEAGAYWLGSDPADGLWHIYTGAWSGDRIVRDEGGNFQFYESPDSVYGATALWQAYNPSPEYNEIMRKLAEHDYATWDDRDTLFESALEMSMQFAVRIWILDGKSVQARRATTTISSDLAAGMRSALWPFTVRFRDIEGGNLKMGAPDVFIDSWNPIAGSNWAYDVFPVKATSDYAFLPHPTNGLNMPQRVERAEVTALTGSIMQVTDNWVSLDYVDEIQVPTDAWVDWDAASQLFVTADSGYPDGLTANLMSVVTYPSDLFDKVTWHDGSPLDVGDFIMGIIMGVDRAKPGSPIYDSSAASIFDSVLAIRITNTNPLTIETYTNQVPMDAENAVYAWWPSGNSGPSPWHTTSLAISAEVDNLLAFSASKATDNSVPWTNYIHGDSLSILSPILAASSLSSHIPYLATMSAYVTPEEADQRWNNLTTWYLTQGHFWVGSGPFYLDDYDWDAKTLTLTRYASFPDLADKWERFQEGSLQILALDYTAGAPGSIFTIIGQNYPSLADLDVLVNGTKVGSVSADVEGSFEFTLEMPVGASSGVYFVTVVVAEGGTPLLKSSLDEVSSHTVVLTLADDGTLRDREELFTHVESTVTQPAAQTFLPVITR